MNYSFRAYDTAKKQWIVDEFAIIGEFIMGGGFFEMHYSLEELNNIDIERALPFADRKKKHLFEGDVIKYSLNGKEYVDVIVYQDGNLSCEPNLINVANLRWVDWFEIIGNVHDTPELIPPKKGVRREELASVDLSAALFKTVFNVVQNARNVEPTEEGVESFDEEGLDLLISETLLTVTSRLPRVLESAAIAMLLGGPLTATQIKVAIDRLNDRIIRK